MGSKQQHSLDINFQLILKKIENCVHLYIESNFIRSSKKIISSFIWPNWHLSVMTTSNDVGVFEWLTCFHCIYKCILNWKLCTCNTVHMTVYIRQCTWQCTQDTVQSCEQCLVYTVLFQVDIVAPLGLFVTRSTVYFFVIGGNDIFL